ncbi:expressed unknown protein [Seminavis robusta]|uniref:Uncharacterized protein n=1 Tax=Seminavis robusta TaxID=568900 RepID=A0A9N8DMC2_9STRA|nr:expressed unknown protein [Seminavis robusta]|eukprot:Sro225_g091870.1 n/a (279) ;mRNA; r:66252-67088
MRQVQASLALSELRNPHQFISFHFSLGTQFPKLSLGTTVFYEQQNSCFTMATNHHINAMNLNSKAIAHLLQGNYYECMLALKFALQTFRMELPPSSDGSTQQHQPRLSLTTRTVSVPTGSSQACAGAFAVFNGAFIFVKDNSNDSQDLVDHHLIPAVLLFNLGLCHHHEAMRDSGCCSIGLEMARRCYSHALTLLETFSDDLRQADMLLLAALANNMAQIASNFMDTQSTHIFGKMLGDILDHTDMEAQLEEEDAHVFFSLNLMIVTELNLHGVAPAA